MNTDQTPFSRDEENNNVWLSKENAQTITLTDHGITPTVLASEAEVGQAMLNELYATAEAKEGDINIALLDRKSVV